MRNFRDRWKAVEMVEAEEQKTASIELRWLQLNSILKMAIGLGLQVPESSDDELIINERCVKLRRLMK